MPSVQEVWKNVRAAASALLPAEEWRRRLAQEVRAATGARVSAVLTCPPGRMLEARGGTDPGHVAPSFEKLFLRFLPRIERGGEGWEAMRQLGTNPYSPLERAQDVELARGVREEILAPLGAETIVNAFLVHEELLLGWIVVGDAGDADALLTRCLPLGEVCRAAAATLAGALALAEACGGGVARRRHPALDTLTGREGQVLRLLAGGLTDAEVADRLGISEQTVGTHLRRVYEKLGVHSRAAAVALLQHPR